MSVLNERFCAQAGKLYLLPPYLAFASHDRKSVRFTIPLCTIRRVERLNARAGIYALSLSLWHSMKIVRTLCLVCMRTQGELIAIYVWNVYAGRSCN